MRQKKFVARNSFCDDESYAEAVAKGVGGPDPTELNGNRWFAFGSGQEADVLRSVWGNGAEEFGEAVMSEQTARQTASPEKFIKKIGKRRSAPKKTVDPNNPFTQKKPESDKAGD